MPPDQPEAGAPVTCRDCGNVGWERPDDPAPNLCPDCFDRRIALVGVQLHHQVPQRGVAGTLAWLRSALVQDVGLTEAAADTFIHCLRTGEDFA